MHTALSPGDVIAIIRRYLSVLAIAAALAFALFSCAPAHAESAAEFFRNDAKLYQGAGRAQPRASARHRAIRPGHGVFAAAARRHGVPVAIALATVKIESGFRCSARGRAGELGPLQIKPATARGLGYRGPVSALNSCGAGLEWGMRHLAIAVRRCGHAGLHNRGLGASCARTAYVARVNAAMRRL